MLPGIVFVWYANRARSQVSDILNQRSFETQRDTELYDWPEVAERPKSDALPAGIRYSAVERQETEKERGGTQNQVSLWS